MGRFCLMVLNISGFLGLNVDTNGIIFTSVFSLTTRKSSLFIFVAFSMPLSILFFLDIFDVLILFVIHPSVFLAFPHL